MLRALAILLAVSLAPIPALGGANEEAFLARIVGKWSGNGTITGTESGKLSCTATFRDVSAGVSFRVKCDIPELGAQSFSGTMSYNEDEKRYESKSPSGEVTIGKKEGNAVVFTAKMKGMAVGTSVMKMTTSRITVVTNVKRPGSSGEIKSLMEMRKS